MMNSLYIIEFNDDNTIKGFLKSDVKDIEGQINIYSNSNGYLPLNESDIIDILNDGFLYWHLNNIQYAGIDINMTFASKTEIRIASELKSLIRDNKINELL